CQPCRRFDHGGQTGGATVGAAVAERQLGRVAQPAGLGDAGCADRQQPGAGFATIVVLSGDASLPHTGQQRRQLPAAARSRAARRTGCFAPDGRARAVDRARARWSAAFPADFGSLDHSGVSRAQRGRPLGRGAHPMHSSISRRCRLEFNQGGVMSHSILRVLACCALLGLVGVGGVQAQTTTSTAALPDFTGIVQKNAAAVVHVEAKYTGDRQRSTQSVQGRMMPGQGMPNDPGTEMLRRFFGMPMMPSPEEQRHTSLGSGFIISSDGYILTNNHVVDHADKVTVRLQDRRTLTAKVVGTDPTYDIALLKVDAGGSLPTVSIGDSRALKPGQWVLAIGSPFGFDYTVTQGIVSAVGRNLGQRDQPYTSFIQTDVPINRGNSGGPLFNLQGQVVGINSQIYSGTGGYQGVSFSIPIDVAMNAVAQLKTKGYVTRGQLGVLVQAVDDDMAKAYKLPDASGAAVAEVTAGSGAEKA